MFVIPDCVAEHIKKCIAAEDLRESQAFHLAWQNPELDRYVRSVFVVCWDNWGFASQVNAQQFFAQYVTVLRVRRWARQNGRSIRKGTMLCENGTLQTRLWDIVGGSGLDSELDGMSWSIRKVDQLKNIYVRFT